MDYRCQVRTLLRTVGLVAGLTLCASAHANEAAATGRGNTTTNSVSPQTEEFTKGKHGAESTMLPGGGGEEQGGQVGERANPCSQPATNCFDRQAGTAPYFQVICGQFNASRFLCADNFIPSANDSVTTICWRGWWSPDPTVCDAPSNPPGAFHLDFYNDSGLGLPGSSISSYTEGVDMTVTQGETGDPVGFNNPTQFEVGFSAVLGSSLAVNGGTCYWVEIDWDKNSGGGALDNCFFEIGQSYEKVEGDRRMVRRDESTGNPYQESDAINRDIMLCVGFAGAAVLNNTNTAPCYPGGGGPSPRTAPANDEIAGNILVSCGTPIVADNTYATNSAGFADPSCRIIGLDPTNYVSNDVFFRFQTGAGVTSAVISTCNSALLGGLAPGDSILQLYSNAAYTTQIGCNDNGCGVLSQILATGLTQNTLYYIRLASVNAGTAGKYTLTVDCPIVVPANDLCTGAVTIATTGSPSTLDLAGVNTPQVTTAITTVDGQFSGCPGVANTANSVWYKLVGGGNPIQLSTDQPVTGLTPYDTRLSVYCSNDGTCNVGQINCIAGNDDIDATNSNFASEVEFCAIAGKTYYVLLHGFGTSTGAAIINARSLRDENTQALLTCCDTQQCTFTCTFEVPCGANDEANASASYNNAGWALVGLNAEPCDNTNDAATNANSGPNPPVASPPRYGKVVEGVAMKGAAWATGGVRDADWWIFHGVTNSDQNPTMVEYTAQFTGPCTQFVSQSRGQNFSTNVFSGLGQLSGWGGSSFCGQTINYRYAFSHPNGTGLGGTPVATNLDGTTPGNEMTWRFRLVQTGAGYPCGTNTDYWLRVDWALATSSCSAVAIPGGADDETTAPAFSGSGGGEACGVDTMDGCGHVPITDDFFTRLQPNVPMTGTMFGSVGSGASIDGESYKVQIPAKSVVRMHIDSSGPTSMGITNDDCTVDAIGYGVAATRGSCFPGGVNAEDLFILDAGTYQVNIFSNDAFGSFPSGIFVNVVCTNPTQRYVATLTTTPVAVCSPVCAGATAEVETACQEFGTECGTDNDGCSEGFFQATASGLTVGTTKNLSGTIFSTFDPPPLGTATYTSDVDYWQFTVAVNARLTFNVVANGPIYGLVADTGVGGANCFDLVNGVRVLGSIDATSCSGGSPASRTVYLTPGTYCIVVAAGSVDTGTNGANLGEDVDNCTNALSYCISATLAAVGRCCNAQDCTITSQAECTGTWDGAATCGNGYTVGALDASCSGFSSIASVPNQLTNFKDEEVRQVAIPAFKFYGTTYTQLGVGSNGYVELIPSGGASTGSGARARQFPNTALPNAIIAPFWRDWEPNAPGAAVYIETSGGVTTVEWNNVGAFNNWNKRASFQVLLTHATGGIEFRYGTFTGLTCEKLDSFAVGAEGLSGLNGAAYTNASAFLNGGHCLKLTPTGAGNPCAAPVCCFGNAAKDSPGAVNFADVTSVLANFGANYGGGNTGPGDADCSSVVNFADITSVLANFGNACP